MNEIMKLGSDEILHVAIPVYTEEIASARSAGPNCSPSTSLSSNIMHASLDQRCLMGVIDDQEHGPMTDENIVSQHFA